jgi:uracil-DNA glycosylase
MNEIESLFERIDKFPYPAKTMIMVKGEINGLAFFPGGKGTYNNGSTISDKEIMILGQDFDCEDNFNVSRHNGKEDIKNNPTWRNLLLLLNEANISPNNCFFTNGILGVRIGNKGTGRSPAFLYPEFIADCQNFFLQQIELQKPKTIFVLGKFSAKFLSNMSGRLNCWNHIKNFETLDESKNQIKKNVVFENVIQSNLVLLTHPSFRPSNVHRRKYNEKTGNEAEVNMIKDVLSTL